MLAVGASNVKEVKTDEEFSTLLKGVTGPCLAQQLVLQPIARAIEFL